MLSLKTIGKQSVYDPLVHDSIILPTMILRRQDHDSVILAIIMIANT